MNRKRWAGLAAGTVCTLLAIMAGIYALAVLRTTPVDDAARRTASGRFVRLSHGQVNYEAAGPASGHPVILISGTTTPFFIWDKNFHALAGAGFRVIRYDHYGKGVSDRPDVPYDRDLYDGLLEALLQKLGIRPPVSLVGISLGGGIAGVFADRHPGWVGNMVLVAPTGFPVPEPAAVKLTRMPVIGDWIMAVAGNGVLVKGTRKAFVNPDRFPEFTEKFKPQLKLRGYHRALLSTLRNMDMHRMGDVYRRVGKRGTRTMLVWGREDRVLPFANSQKVLEAIPHAAFHPIPHAGHNLVYEYPDIFNPLLIGFLHRPNG